MLVEFLFLRQRCNCSHVLDTFYGHLQTKRQLHHSHRLDKAVSFTITIFVACNVKETIQDKMHKIQHRGFFLQTREVVLKTLFATKCHVV